MSKDKDMDMFTSLLEEYGQDPEDFMNAESKEEFSEKLKSLPEEFFQKLARKHISQVMEEENLVALNLDEIEDVEIDFMEDGTIAMSVKDSVKAVPKEIAELLEKEREHFSDSMLVDSDEALILEKAFKDSTPEIWDEEESFDTDKFNQERESMMDGLFGMAVHTANSDISKRLDKELEEFEKTAMKKAKTIDVELPSGKTKKERPTDILKALESIVDDMISELDKEEDKVNHPSHYQKNGMECIDFIEAVLSPEEFKGFLKGNMMKYEWRAGLKEDNSKEQDLNKSKWYKDKLDSLK